MYPTLDFDHDFLLGAVCFYVLLCSMLGVLGSMDVMGVRKMGVMGRFLMVPCFVVICRFMMMTRGMFMMLGRLPMMMGCFL